MAAKTVTDHLALGMGFMTLGTIGNLAVYLMTERTGLLCMGALIIDEVLTGSFMTGEARFFYVISKLQVKRLMGIGVAGKAVFQFKVGLSLMTHGTLRNDVLTPGWMFCVTVKTGNCCLVFAAIIGDRGGCILVTFYTVRNIQSN